MIYLAVGAGVLAGVFVGAGAAVASFGLAAEGSVVLVVDVSESFPLTFLATLIAAKGRQPPRLARIETRSIVVRNGRFEFIMG
ncbi:MAG: hypothetical protein WCO47_04715 [Methylococcus sp.]|jgi:hypothetical protein